MGPYTDTCIHLRDIARPLHLDADVSLQLWQIVLDYLVSGRGSDAFVRRGSLDMLRLRATDAAWQYGHGDEVTGPSEALAMAITGRKAALHDLDGVGVDRLRRS